MPKPPPSAAASLYPNLPSAARAERPERKGSVADAMWHNLSREQKAKEADQRLWNKIVKRHRDIWLKNLREGRGGR